MQVNEAINSLIWVRDSLVDGRAYLILENCIKELADLDYIIGLESIDE
jgi:hypothetical protein